MKKALSLLRAFFFALGLTACGRTEAVFPGSIQEIGASLLIEMDKEVP